MLEKQRCSKPPKGSSNKLPTTLLLGVIKMAFGGGEWLLRHEWTSLFPTASVIPGKRGRLTGMKLNLGFSCGWWPAPTAVLTAPLNPIKHASSCFPLFLPFFFLQNGAIDIRRKIHGVGAEQRRGRGVGCLEPSVNS